jgi:large subunit ribosomal protein L23
MRSVWDVIKSPMITEKAIALRQQSQDAKQVLTFYVAVNANKIEIKDAVAKIFKVQVDSVRVINCQGKTKKRGRFEGRQSDWRKAYVTLKAGEKLVDYGEII